jgi:hypothetical protein
VLSINSQCNDFLCLFYLPRCHCVGTDDLWVQALWWNPSKWHLIHPRERRAPSTATYLHHRCLHDHGQVWVTGGGGASTLMLMVLEGCNCSETNSPGPHFPEEIASVFESGSQFQKHHKHLQQAFFRNHLLDSSWPHICPNLQANKLKLKSFLSHYSQIFYDLSCSMNLQSCITFWDLLLEKLNVSKCLTMSNHGSLIQSLFLLWLKSFKLDLCKASWSKAVNHLNPDRSVHFDKC